jgi:hypothetical protein
VLNVLSDTVLEAAELTTGSATVATLPTNNAATSALVDLFFISTLF